MSNMQLAVVPAMSLEDAAENHNRLVNFVHKLMVSGVDYGVIPGSNKPTLLKPGAEKLANFFRLVPRFTELETVEDWTGEHHKNEPFFYYKMLCQLSHHGEVVSECIASINSFESKYRYRNMNRVCPECGKETIIKGKVEYGGGYICFAKKGGCGFKFKDDDVRITGQATGKVANENIFDQVNTLQKMVQKRALIGSILIGVGASELFTQDLDEVVIEGNWTEDARPRAESKPAEKKLPEDKPINGKNAPTKKYDESVIGPDFDGPPPLDEYGNEIQTSKPARADVDIATGEVLNPEVKKPDPKKPEAKPGEMAVSSEFVEGVLEYRTENGAKMVKWGSKWKPAQAIAKDLSAELVDAALALFPDPKRDNKPNTFEAANHLKKHFKVQYWKSLTWEQLASVFAAKKFGHFDSRWYPEEAAEQHAQDGHPEEAALIESANAFDVRKFYGIPDGEIKDISPDDVRAFEEAITGLKDPTVLKVMLDGGLVFTNPKHFSYFLSTAELLSTGQLEVGGEDFDAMIGYALDGLKDA